MAGIGAGGDHLGLEFPQALSHARQGGSIFGAADVAHQVEGIPGAQAQQIAAGDDPGRAPVTDHRQVVDTQPGHGHQRLQGALRRLHGGRLGGGDGPHRLARIAAGRQAAVAQVAVGDDAGQGPVGIGE